MCSEYWTLVVPDMACPKCDKVQEWPMQTHYEGYPGACVTRFRLGEPIEHLKGITDTLDRGNDWFIHDCKFCKEFIDFGADIADGVVTKVWVLPEPEFTNTTEVTTTYTNTTPNRRSGETP